MSFDYSRLALGSLPGRVNAQVGQVPVVGSPAAAGQENLPIPAVIPKSSSKKRKSTEAHMPTAPIDLDDIDVDGMVIDQNCDQVRRKINRLLDSGSTTKTAFAREIGVGAKSLTGFLGTHGRDNGSGFAAYGAAWAYFKKLDIAGVKIPVKKQKTSPAGEGSSAVAATSATTTAKAAASSATVDISDIDLAGEGNDTVPVLDTCDEIRRKITAHFKKTGVSQAQFCRDIYAQLKGPSSLTVKPFQGAQLARFRGMKGPISGATLPLYYAAYIYFEKVRIKEGKPKTKHRLGMEKTWGGAGMNRDHDGRQGYWCRPGESPRIDQYGKLSFS